MIHNKQILYGLDHSQYEHNFDRKALNALEKTPGVAAAGKWVNKNLIEKVVTVQYTGSNLRVTRESYPRVYDYLQYACEVLDIHQVPDLYTSWSYGINACTIGSENPIIILDSGLIDLCDDDEILFVVGHECGHIKSNHMLYHMMAQSINIIIDSIPGGNLVGAPLQYALYYWDRMSEFTADRAGLLCCQNKDAAIRAFVKMAGLPRKEYAALDPSAFVQQAEQFKDLDYDNMSKLIKFISILDDTHPWTVMRAAELIKWVDAGEYQRLMTL